MSNATTKDDALRLRLLRAAGIDIDRDDARTLRRACMTLQRWHELECGDGNQWGSWAIERDDNGDGLPYFVHHHYRHGHGKDTTTRRRIPDRERGALARVAALCKRLGLHYYQQGDPRGCALFVAREPINSENYHAARVVSCDVE